MRKQTIENPGTLYFGKGNAKLGPNVATFSIPAGHTCPGAMDCLSKFDRSKRKLIDGPHLRHRCFAASTEAARPSVRRSTDRNWKLLLGAKSQEVMASLIHHSIPGRAFDTIRVHVSGDFYNMDYLLAWLAAAKINDDRLFYAYTKSLNFLVKAMEMKMVPPNFVFTASRGGKFDHLIDKYGLREAVVVHHPEEAERLGLATDHDDSLARDPEVAKFALLLHGQQPAGSLAASSMKRMKKEGVKNSYGKKSKPHKV